MLGKYERAILQFSGGKDSTALIYLARPYLDRITVMFIDTWATFPHVLEFAEETCRKLGADLQIVRPPIPVRDYIDAAGLPSDIVPVEATLEFSPLLNGANGGTRVQSWMRCCGAMLWGPLDKAVRDSGIKLVLRGSKKADARVGAPPGFIEDGIEYSSPLWDWSHDDVFSYLKREGVTLPKQYRLGCEESLDCTICTAFLADHYHGRSKLEYIRENHPELWPELRGRLSALQGALVAEAKRMTGSFAMLAEDRSHD
jgi:phosphoadenosine phosphosulfate reductase